MSGDMCPNNSKNVEDRRVESEIDRNEAERLKFLSEAEEIEKRIKTKLFSSKIFIQSVVAGIVAAGLLAAWGISYLKPIIQKNNELASLENRILSAENKKQMQLNEAQKKELVKLKEKVKNELEQLKIQNSELQKQLQISVKSTADLNSKLKSISKEYEDLSKRHEATEAERAKYSALALSARQNSTAAAGLLAGIKESSKQTEIRSRSLSDDIITTFLNDTRWIISSSKDPSMVLKVVFLFLGMLEVDGVIDPTSTWIVKDSEIIMELNDPWNLNRSGVYKSKVEGYDFGTLTGQAKNKEGETWYWKGSMMNPGPS